MKFNIKSAVCRIGLACAIALCTPYLSSGATITAPTIGLGEA